MRKIILSLLFLSSYAVNAQETWNACNSTVNVIPQPSYDSTFVLSAPSRAALAKGMASWTPATSSGASYLVYTALLTQTGTDAPVATVLENTLGFTPTYSYIGAGDYNINHTNGFTVGKTCIITSGDSGLGDDTYKFKAYRLNSDSIRLYITSDGTPSDYGLIGLTVIEIRVYP